MSDQMSKAEQGVRCLSKDIASVKTDIVKIRKNASEESKRLEKLIGDTVEKKLADPRGQDPAL